jgi:hypothetical protein
MRVSISSRWFPLDLAFGQELRVNLATLKLTLLGLIDVFHLLVSRLGQLEQHVLQDMESVKSGLPEGRRVWYSSLLSSVVKRAFGALCWSSRSATPLW